MLSVGSYIIQLSCNILQCLFVLTYDMDFVSGGEVVAGTVYNNNSSPGQFRNLLIYKSLNLSTLISIR
jgi:hypothetical protein